MPSQQLLYYRSKCATDPTFREREAERKRRSYALKNPNGATRKWSGRTKWPAGYDEKLKRRIRKRNFRAAIKALILEHYGTSCACCGEANQMFLSVDHIDGGGNRHRKELKLQGSSFNVWLRDNGFPPGYQILCFNCNFAKGIYSACPHSPDFDAARVHRAGTVLEEAT